MKSSIQKNEIESFNEALPLGFKTTLKRWIESIILEGITPKFMVNDMVEILEVINKMESISFLQDDTTSTFVVVSTTHTTKEFYSVEMPKLGILSKHIAQCKGHSKGGGVPLQLGIV